MRRSTDWLPAGPEWRASARLVDRGGQVDREVLVNRDGRNARRAVCLAILQPFIAPADVESRIDGR